MKNYLLFIIDSLNYSHLEESEIELMPFLRKLEREGVSCENMYSQAPYTEAAVMNIYCGQDVLDHGGYLHRFKNVPVTIFEAMQRKGYTTYFNSYQPQCHPSSIKRGVDHLYYNVGYDQEALWSYRFNHYADVNRKGNLTEGDYADLREILEDNFCQWLVFTDLIMSGDSSVEMIRDNAPDYDAEKVREQVKEQLALYQQDAKAYIQEILHQGRNHPIFKIPTFVQNYKIADRSVAEQIGKELMPLCKRIRRMGVRLNLKNGRGLFAGPVKKCGELIRHPNIVSLKNLAKSILLSVNSLVDTDLFQRLDNCDRFKNSPSGRKHVDHFVSWAKNRQEQTPYFACIHIDDIHNAEVFFTYDTDDIELIRKEAKMASDLLDQIPGTYHGSLTHDLSLRYIDSVVEYLYQQMQNNGILEDTCILICADHGFSFSGNPLRDSFVVNLYLENYKIPCVVTGTGLEPHRLTELRSSKDIPATLCELADGVIPEAFSGHSVREAFEYPCVQVEYCGGGCPDISRRELKIAAFDKGYFVGTLGTIQQSLNDEMIAEVYDLRKDPQQLHNLAKKGYDKNLAKPLLSLIQTRREQIMKSLSDD